MSAIHETKQHGKLDFPYTVYQGRLPQWLSGFPLHWHDEMEMIYVTKGSMIVGIQNEELVLRENDMALIQPQLIHCIKQNGSDTADYFNVLFRLSMLSGENDICTEKYLNPIYSGECIIPKYLKKDDTLNIKISPFLRRMSEISGEGYDGREMIIKSYLFAILHFLNSSSQQESPREQQIRNLYDKLKRSLDYIQKNYAEEITVDKAAAQSNFSASHFAKMFRQLTGTSFNKYLVNYRLEIAEKMLKAEDNSISETAFACGFNNLSYFTRAFKEKYGITPNSYKKKYSQKSKQQ